jgi:hypothetical protein
MYTERIVPYYYYMRCRLFAGYSQNYTRNKTCFYGNERSCCSVSTICATSNVISLVICVLYFYIRNFRSMGGGFVVVVQVVGVRKLCRTHKRELLSTPRWSRVQRWRFSLPPVQTNYRHILHCTADKFGTKVNDDLQWVWSITVPMHLGITDRRLVSHNLTSDQESPARLPKFQMAPTHKTLMSLGRRKESRYTVIFSL